MRYSNKSVWLTSYANDLDAFIPEVWAQESLMILEASMVAANLVHRDFQNEIAQAGDVVNTRKPAEFTATRKIDTDSVTVQDATATNVAVKLDQHLHTSFLIRDGEESKGFITLRDEYLAPALLSIGQSIDQIVLTQAYQFLANTAGKLGTNPGLATIVGLREVMNTLKVPQQGRNLIITPDTEGALLQVTDFINADKIGDEGSALREGSLGRKFGFDSFMCQNTPSIATGNTVQYPDVNNGAGYPIGTVTMTIHGGITITDGSWFVVDGDDTPQRITSVTGTPATEITFEPGLRHAVVDTAVLTVYTPGAVNFGAGYDAAYAKTLVVNGFSVAPKSGQLITFGNAPSAAAYGAIGTPTTVGVLLDRPLEATAAHTTEVGVGPAGSYNFAFHKNALALVMRPLAAPAAGTGALSYVANYNGLSVRITITYDGNKQGHLVTADVLCGVKVLDTSLGAVMFG